MSQAAAIDAALDAVLEAVQRGAARPVEFHLGPLSYYQWLRHLMPDARFLGAVDEVVLLGDIPIYPERGCPEGTLRPIYQAVQRG